MNHVDKLQMPGLSDGVSKRRHLLVGAGLAGAAAVAMKVLPGAAPEALATAAVPKVAPDTGGGYQLTAHVRRYYESTQA